LRRPYIACAFGVAALGAASAAGAVGADRAAAPRGGQVVAVEVPHYPVVRSVRAALRGDWLRWPLAGGSVTGRFGEQRAGHRHQGIDIPRPVGTPIHAAGDGTVVMREWQDGYGNYTCIRHVRVLSCYAHQSRFHTRLGDRVRQGDVIGFTGDTGTSEAPHLHFEVRHGRRPWTKPVNPLRYLPHEPARFR
jgi:murein DD-endopeptidase MepM/ murein hydrolase activator NlpD